MMLGPDEIRTCPFCKAEMRIRTMASGNNIDAKSWSDGYTYARMMPPRLFIAECRTCLKIFWIKDSPLIGELDNIISFDEDYYLQEEIKIKLQKLYNIPKDKYQLWKEIEYLTQLNKSQLMQAVKNRLWSNRDEEIYIRQNLWWKINDTVRNNSGGNLEDKDIAIFESNLKTLIDIYKNEKSEIILKAEAYRELGEFERSSEILSSIQMDKKSLFIDVIKKANEERDRNVLSIYEDFI